MSVRPDRHTYFMGIAMAVRERADCRGQKVGAAIVLDHHIVSTGYNGTPSKMKNCSEGGCQRCANRDKKYASGTAYDLCICVHAEQNALLAAAKFGISVQGGVLYTTTQPCFGCLKEMLQAGINEVYYVHEWTSPRDEEQQKQYNALQAHLPNGVHRLPYNDPREAWAKGPTSVQGPSDPHGMQNP